MAQINLLRVFNKQLLEFAAQVAHVLPDDPQVQELLRSALALISVSGESEQFIRFYHEQLGQYAAQIAARDEQFFLGLELNLPALDKIRSAYCALGPQDKHVVWEYASRLQRISNKYFTSNAY